MKAFHAEILSNTIAYIAKRYYELTGKHIVQILMYKILALVDYRCVTETGVPCTELEYWAEPRGPVPHTLKEWNDSLTEKKSSLINGHKAQIFVCKGEPDMDYLSEYERELIDFYINRAVDEHWDAFKASIVSHEEIKAWKKARERDNHKMSYADEFQELYEKSLSSLSSAEKKFIDYQTLSANVAV